MNSPSNRPTLRLQPKPPQPTAPPPAPVRATAPPPPPARANPRPPQAPRPNPKRAPAAVRPAPTGERLAKQVAHMIPCSRAEAEQYIEGAWVKVDGKTVEEPQCRVQPHQVITIDPKARLENLLPVTMVMNKPADCAFDEAYRLLTPAHRAKDTTGVRILQRHFKQLECIVPLADAASGLLIFTQDWRVIRKLQEDASSIEHELMVEVQGGVSAQSLENLQRKAKADSAYPFTKISLSSTNPQRSTLRFAVKGWHKGWITFLCQSAQLEIVAMRRTRLGRVSLGDLPVGQWRYLLDKI